MVPHVLWFTGLSASGKSTIANYIKNEFPDYVILDGDVIRKGLNSDLGFSEHDRKENLRRVREVARLFVENNMNVIVSFITPFEDDRKAAKNYIPNCFIVYIKASLDTCEKRDPKGLYKRARNGEIKDFTGIDSPYEIPANPDIIFDTENNSIEEIMQQFRTWRKNVLDKLQF